MKIKNISMTILMSFLIFTTKSFANMPVFDFATWTQVYKQYNEMKQEYTEMQSQTGVMKNQYQLSKQVKSESESHSGFGNLFEGGQYTANRQWSPDNWQDTLKGLSGGNPERYQQLVSQYKHDNPTLSQSDYARGESADNAAVYQSQVQNNQAATVTASYAFNNIKTHLDHINEIAGKIESSGNEKAAIDLNTRMEAEIAYVQVEILKQTALMNEQMARNNSDSIAYETAAAKFNRLPDE